MTDTLTRPPETEAGRAARQMAADLVEAAALAEQIEAAVPGVDFSVDTGRLLGSVMHRVDQRAALVEVARVMGHADKREAGTDGRLLGLYRQIGTVTVEVLAHRDEVCERVQVGTETVEATVVVTPAVARTETVERPVYEWRCGPLLVEPTKAVA